MSPTPEQNARLTIDSALEAAGWLVLRFWEHETPSSVAERIGRIVRARRAAVSA